LGDYYLRARYYDTEIGRFIRRDDYEGGIQNPLTLHKYVYTHNNPVNATDPTGLFLETAATQRILNDLQAQQTKQAAITLATFTNQLVKVGQFVAIAFAKAMETSVKVAYTLSRQFGIPVIIWGNDLPETTRHQFDALTFSGNTFDNPTGATGQSNFIGPVLIRTARYPGRWYNSYPPCQGRSPGDGKICDEYPYATTLQGGRDNYLKGNVSIRLVPAYEQSLRSGQDGQGGRLGTFYREAPVNRVEDPGGGKDSIFVNLAFPFLGFSFWLDRQGLPHRF
jgi:hypothetical protein